MILTPVKQSENVYNVKNFGALGNTKKVTDAVLNGTSTVTSATANFTAADVGKVVFGVETSSGALRLPRGTIQSVTDSTTIVVTTTASGSYSSISLVWGTDDSVAIIAAVTAAKGTQGSNVGTVYVPSGGYLFSQTPFDFSHPSGSGGAIRDNFAVVGDGSGTTVFYMDPSFDAATVASNHGFFAKNTSGGNTAFGGLSGMTLDGSSYAFSGSGKYGAQLYLEKGRVFDLHVKNMRGFTSALQTAGNNLVCTRVHVENSYFTNWTVASGQTLIECYSGNSTTGRSLLVDGFSVSSYTSAQAVIINSLIDESTACALRCQADAVLIGTTCYGPSGQYAIELTNNCTVRAFGARLTPFSTSGNRNGVSVASGSTLYLSGCTIDRAGTGTACNNLGTIYDLGGNQFLNGVTGNLPISQFHSEDIRVRGYVTSESAYAGGNIRTAKASVTLSGASTATGNIIPAGCFVIGVATTTTTTITGASGYTVGDGADVDRWGDITGTAVGTDTDNTNSTANPTGYFAAASAVTLTAKTSNFTGGVVQVVVFYLTTSAE